MTENQDGERLVTAPSSGLDGQPWVAGARLVGLALLASAPGRHRLDRHRLDRHRLDRHRLDRHRLGGEAGAGCPMGAGHLVAGGARRGRDSSHAASLHRRPTRRRDPLAPDGDLAGLRHWWRGGANTRPTTAEAGARLQEHIPELVPAWLRLTAMIADDAGDDAGAALALWNPPPFLTGCSQAAVRPGGPALIRNYDWDYRLFDGVVARTAYTGRPVLGMLDCLWGLLTESTTPGSRSP